VDPARREAAIAFACSLGLGAALLWPMPLAPAASLVGHPGNDGWNHAWGYDWVARALAAGTVPLRDHGLAWPGGGALWFIDTAQAALVAPVTWLFGAAAAYNLVMLVGLALSAFGAFLLARRVSGDTAGAAVAAVVYGAAPHLLGQSYNGISETVDAGGLPLTLWALLTLLDAPSPGRALRLGLIAGFTVLTSFYVGFFAALAAAVVVLGVLATERRSVDWRRAVPGVALALAVAVAVSAPAFSAFQQSLDAADGLVKRDPAFVWDSLLRHNVTDVLAFVRPGRTPSPDLKALYGEDLLIVISLGWVALVLAAVGLVGARRPGVLGAWLALGALFFAFSLGPYLTVGAEPLLVGGEPVPMPFLAMFELVPVFDRISHPFRFVLGVQLAVAVAAAEGVRWLGRRAGPRARGLLGAGVAAAVLVEVATLTPARVPVPLSDARIPAAYAAMAEDPTPGAVLDLPLALPNLERAVYVWAATAHGRPVPWGLNDPMPAFLLGNRLTATLLRVEAGRAWTLPGRVPSLDLVVAGRALARRGLRYVVLHERLLPAFKREQVEAILTGLWGEPARHPADGLLVWVVPAPADGAADGAEAASP
jgi:hypothetical protein